VPKRRRPSALRSEWIKLLGSRGTLVALGTLALLPIGFAALVVGNTPSTDPPGQLGDDDIVANTLVGVLVAVIIAAVVGAVTVGNEERSGMISTSYAAIPRRHHVILAKTAVAALSTFVLGVASSAASYFVARPLQRGQGYVAPSYPEPDVLAGSFVRAVVGTGVLTALVAVYAVGVATVVRRTAIAIPVVVGTLLLPGLLATGERVARFAQNWTPFAGFAIQHTVRRTDYYAGPWHGLAVTAAYAAAALIAGVALSRRRDV
jgi:hypothetical protein